MFNEIKESYVTADFANTIRLIDRHFGHSSYSLKSLFKDEQRRILDGVLASAREDLESRFRLITERYTPLMRFLESVGAPLPEALETVSNFVLHREIWNQFATGELQIAHLRNLIEDAKSRGTEVLDAELSYAIRNRMERMMTDLRAEPDSLERMRLLEQVTELVMPLPLGLNLWKVQNTYWEMMQELVPERRARAGQGDGAALEWLQQFLALGDRLGFAVKHLQSVGQAQEQAA
jgi:hypothetical protein